jgi:hypothetical protein
LILALAFAAAFQPQPGSTIVGRVRSDGSGAPLRYALVEVVRRAGEPRIAAQTDARGYYVLEDVPTGRLLLRATHIDHAAHEVELIVSSSTRLYHDFELSLRPVQLPVVNARALMLITPRTDTIRYAAPDLGTAGVHVLEATPGVAELGLAEAAREIPGHEPPDPSDVLFVRGAEADLKLILLNGAPVFAPFHIGGLITALNTDMLRSATLHVGGAPARYDGGLSYVMDMETRQGRGGRARAELGVDMLSARFVTEGPITDRVTYMLGGRGVHGLGALPFIDEAFPYAYGDGLGRVDVDFGKGHSLTLTGFWNRETVRFDTAATFRDGANWGNAAGSVRYHGDMAGGEALVTFGVGDFQTRVPLGGTQPLVSEGSSRRVRVSGDFTRTLGDTRLYFGGSFDRLLFENRVWAQGDSPDEAVALDAVGSVAGVYTEAVFSPVKRVRLRGGLRADVFSIDFEPRLAPRLAASFALGDRASLTLAGGRYRQYVRASDPSRSSVNATVPDKPPPPMAVAEASHYVLALDQAIGEKLGFAIEGFYKTFSGLPEEDGRDEAQASGIDLFIRRGGRVSGFFGYSLAWVWYTPEDRPFAKGRSFAGRHLVSAGVNAPIVGNGTFNINVAYGSGLPYTAIPEPELSTPVFGVAFRPASSASEPAAATAIAPDEPYLRLDAQIQRTWQADWFGVVFAVTPYVKVLNALDRRDALFYHLDRTEAGTDLRALASLPVLPVLGMTWRF